MAAERRADTADRLRGEGEEGLQGPRSVPKLFSPLAGSLSHAIDDTVRYRRGICTVLCPRPGRPNNVATEVCPETATTSVVRPRRATPGADVPHTAIVTQHAPDAGGIALDVDISRVVRIATHTARSPRLRRQDRHAIGVDADLDGLHPHARTPPGDGPTKACHAFPPTIDALAAPPRPDTSSHAPAEVRPLRARRPCHVVDAAAVLSVCSAQRWRARSAARFVRVRRSTALGVPLPRRPLFLFCTCFHRLSFPRTCLIAFDGSSCFIFLALHFHFPAHTLTTQFFPRRALHCL